MHDLLESCTRVVSPHREGDAAVRLKGSTVSCYFWVLKLFTKQRGNKYWWFTVMWVWVKIPIYWTESIFLFVCFMLVPEICSNSLGPYWLQSFLVIYDSCAPAACWFGHLAPPPHLSPAQISLRFPSSSLASCKQSLSLFPLNHRHIFSFPYPQERFSTSSLTCFRTILTKICFFLLYLGYFYDVWQIKLPAASYILYSLDAPHVHCVFTRVSFLFYFHFYVCFHFWS